MKACLDAGSETWKRVPCCSASVRRLPATLEGERGMGKEWHAKQSSGTWQRVSCRNDFAPKTSKSPALPLAETAVVGACQIGSWSFENCCSLQDHRRHTEILPYKWGQLPAAVDSLLCWAVDLMFAERRWELGWYTYGIPKPSIPVFYVTWRYLSSYVREDYHLIT